MMVVRLPTPPSNHTVPPSCGVAPHRTRTSHQSLTQSEIGPSVSARIVIKQSRKVHNSPDKSQKSFFCRTTVSHTLGKHSTRPHDTTRSNLTGSRSRRAARSEGAAQKKVRTSPRPMAVCRDRSDRPGRHRTAGVLLAQPDLVMSVTVPNPWTARIRPRRLATAS